MLFGQISCINVNKKGDEKKKQVFNYGMKVQTKISKPIATEGNINRQTCCFPSLALWCRGETARGGQTLLDTLVCFMVTYFKACMLFSDCRR